MTCLHRREFSSKRRGLERDFLSRSGHPAVAGYERVIEPFIPKPVMVVGLSAGTRAAHSLHAALVQA